MHFLSDAIAEIEGLLEVNRDFCKKQMAEKASSALPTNCAVVPLFFFLFFVLFFDCLLADEGGFYAVIAENLNANV